MAVRSKPHLPTGFCADDQFVTMSGEVRVQNASEVFLGGARRRSVVVRQVEVRYSQIESTAHHRAAVLKRVYPAEVVPQTERDRRQHQTAAPATAILHRVITRTSWHVCH